MRAAKEQERGCYVFAFAGLQEVCGGGANAVWGGGQCRAAGQRVVGARHWTARDGTGRHWTALDGTGRDGTARDGTGRNGTERDGTGGARHTPPWLVGYRLATPPGHHHHHLHWLTIPPSYHLTWPPEATPWPAHHLPTTWPPPGWPPPGHHLATTFTPTLTWPLHLASPSCVVLSRVTRLVWCSLM